MNKTARRVRSRNSAVLCLIGVFIFGLGYLFGHGNLQLDKNYVPHLVKRELGKPKDVDFDLFWDVYSRVQDESLHSATAQTTLYGAISGAVSALNDPYSTFLTPEETKLFLSDLSGQVEGIGAEIGKRNGVPVVIAPIDGSPAAQAGLKKGDNIIAIDGQSTENMSLDAAVLKIRGAPGSQVKLTVLREGEEKTREITITRAAVAVKDAEWQVTRGVMVVRARQFGDSVDNDLEQVAAEMKSKKITKLIIDLRDNPGGLLDKAVAALSEFLPADKVAVKQVEKDGSIEELKTSGSPIIPDARAIVLVNGGSASASEIFTGAFQDHKRGQVIGEKTFGKGTVQALEELKGGSSLKLTVAKWLTPSGREIDKGGIEPDITVPMSQEDYDAGRDPQLDRAFVEINR
ncbi:MAG TPA: S41 family peptidase [Patescibacteria group bacterium]|nr:S41 family peptidase [Patescibacteria group bacterium]